MPYLWQVSVVNFKNKAVISGTILGGNPPKNKSVATSLFGIIGSYFNTTFPSQKITIVVNGQSHHTQTNNQSGFILVLDKPVNSEFQIFTTESAQPLEIIQPYRINFNHSNFPISVISDIDDTILVSYTLSFWKRISTLLFVSPKKRTPINFSQEILQKIDQLSGSVFYISKSESNLFPVLTAFIEHHKLPLGNLILTPYIKGFQILNSKKGKDFKYQMIQMILENSSHKKFILLGDDTQQDISVYTQITREYPERIFKIYIRKTQKSLAFLKTEQLNTLMKLPVSTVYFTDSSTVLDEINKIENYQNTLS